MIVFWLAALLLNVAMLAHVLIGTDPNAIHAAMTGAGAGLSFARLGAAVAER